jgi:hypothetical protein
MSSRRDFVAALAGAWGASMACAPAAEENPSEDALRRALAELNEAAAIGIAPDDFELSWDYAAGAYREAKATLRPIVLDSALDLPVAFSAKRGRP